MSSCLFAHHGTALSTKKFNALDPISKKQPDPEKYAPPSYAWLNPLSMREPVILVACSLSGCGPLFFPSVLVTSSRPAGITVVIDVLEFLPLDHHALVAQVNKHLILLDNLILLAEFLL